MVIFLTSSKPGDFISLEDLVDCQKQWLEMRKGQSQDSKTGERRALGWEGISTHAENAKGGSRIWLLETIVLEQSGQKETCREKLNDLGDVQYHSRPNCRRQVSRSFRLGSKSEPCGLTSCTGFLFVSIHHPGHPKQTLSPAAGGSWKTPKSLFFSKLCWEFQPAQRASPLCLKHGSDVPFSYALTWLLWAFCLFVF